MKVLHTPVNYGSLASHSVRLLRDAGVDASGLIFSNSVVQSFDGLKVISVNARPPSPRWAVGMARWMSAFTETLLSERPDVIHWYFGRSALPLALDFRLVRHIPRLVEWQGSDIRNPELESAENPYYQRAFVRGYEHVESAASSRQRQERFARAGFACAAPVGMLQYIQRDLFPNVQIVPQRILLSDYRCAVPDPTNPTPLVVHSPTAPVAKGTQAVLDAVERLKSHYRFEFKLIQNMPRHEAIAWMERADIFLDQFVLGDRGMAALEAMAMGKPVICYIKPSLVPLYPKEMPIVNASQETLSDALKALLCNPAQRADLGQRGREFMEAHYAAPHLVAQLNQLYQTVITQFQGREEQHGNLRSSLR